MYKKDLETASGMWGLWNYDTYKHIDDYDKWDAFLENGEVSEDALSDFVVIIKSGVNPETEYRTKINTFSEDD